MCILGVFLAHFCVSLLFVCSYSPRKPFDLFMSYLVVDVPGITLTVTSLKKFHRVSPSTGRNFRVIWQVILSMFLHFLRTFSQHKTKKIKGAFTYYVITEGGGGVSKMLTHDYGEEGEGLASWWHKQKYFFSQIEIVLKQKTIID